MLFWICLVCIITALVLYFRQVYSRFSRYGVKHFTPIPPLGTLWSIFFGKAHYLEDYETSYFPGERFVGKYEFTKPALIIRDLELVKKITVKDYEHFIDHRLLADEKNDPFFGRNLYTLKGQDWKDMRSSLSPVFTSSKIRLMVPLMVQVGEQMVKFVKRQIKESDYDYADLDNKDLVTRFANDVIATCAFGLKVDSLMDRDNGFYMMGKKLTSFTYSKIFFYFLFICVPNVMSKLHVKIIAPNVSSFFKKLVLGAMSDREARGVVRPDLIHLLLEVKKGKLTHDDKVSSDAGADFAAVEESAVGNRDVQRAWTDDELVAQVILFFVAGFDTVSAAMTFLLYELAVNPDVQDRLYQEIIENDVRNGGQFDYNSVQQMTYLDMVISESLRMWPPAFSLDRLCTKDYNLGKPNDNAAEDYIIRKGETLQIPVWSFHKNPEFFPEPHKFDPERFSDQNKHNIKPYTYSPFGIGPRSCIASKFGLCQMKVMVYQLLKHIELSPAEKTRIPAKLSKKSFYLSMEGGDWLRFRTRL